MIDSEHSRPRGSTCGPAAPGARFAVAILCATVLFSPAAPARPAFLPPASQAASIEPVEPVVIPGTSLVIDRPSNWQHASNRGPGTILSFMGGADGYPHFTVQSDEESRLPASASERTTAMAIEDLFRQIVEAFAGAEVHSEEWLELAGLRVHSSLMSWTSPAGRQQARRLILVRDGVPYVFSWGGRVHQFLAAADLIERCALSLRERGGVPGLPVP